MFKDQVIQSPAYLYLYQSLPLHKNYLVHNIQISITKYFKAEYNCRYIWRCIIYSLIKNNFVL